MARNLRISLEEAQRLGWVKPEPTGDTGRTAPKRAVANRPTPGGAHDPQRLLAALLRQELGESEVQEEVGGLIPGRKYRADILLPASAVVIEFDGFQYHRSLEAFQSDRRRQNAFIEAGFRVLRYFNRQMRHEPDAVVQQILTVHERYRPIV